MPDKKINPEEGAPSHGHPTSHQRGDVGKTIPAIRGGGGGPTGEEFAHEGHRKNAAVARIESYFQNKRANTPAGTVADWARAVAEEAGCAIPPEQVDSFIVEGWEGTEHRVGYLGDGLSLIKINYDEMAKLPVYLRRLQWRNFYFGEDAPIEFLGFHSLSGAPIIKQVFYFDDPRLPG